MLKIQDSDQNITLLSSLFTHSLRQIPMPRRVRLIPFIYWTSKVIESLYSMI